MKNTQNFTQGGIFDPLVRFALPVLAVMARTRGRSLKLAKSEFLPLLLMGLLFSTSSLTLFLSYNYMDAGIASTLLFVYPIMVALLMSLVFKEKLRYCELLLVVEGHSGGLFSVTQGCVEDFEYVICLLQMLQSLLSAREDNLYRQERS